MATHPAVVTPATGAPLQILQVPTISPVEGEVRVRVKWTASTPLDMHQAEGSLMVKHPQVIGSGFGGSVVEVGPSCKRLEVGDSVRFLSKQHLRAFESNRPLVGSDEEAKTDERLV